jgi:MFS family permease
MAFFRNSAINRLNLHYAIEMLALSGGGMFFLVFMVKVGVPVPVAFLTQAAILAGRFALRPLILPLAIRHGLKPLLIVGTFGVAAIFPLLAQVHGVGPELWAVIAVTSIADIFYWPSYHAYFAAVGDAEHRGHQVSLREAANAGIGVVGPIAAGWSLATAGPAWTFWAIALIQAASVIPLVGAPNVTVAKHAPGSFRYARLGVALFLADGWLGAAFYFFWQVALFVSVGSSYRAYGGAMALAALLGGVGSLLLGRHIDASGGRRAVLIAYGLAVGLLVCRALSLGSPWLAVAANAPGTLVAALYIPTVMAAVYNAAKASPCPFRFHMMSEGAWDIGGGAGCLAGAAVTASGHSLAWAILLGAPSAIVTVVLLTRHYGRLSTLAAAG